MKTLRLTLLGFIIFFVSAQTAQAQYATKK